MADDLAAEVKRATGVENNDLIADVEYDSVRERMYFKNKLGDNICEVNVHDFLIDGMLEDVDIIPYGDDSALEMIFNTDAGSKRIVVPIGDLFEASDYWNINTTTQKLSELEDKVTKQLSWSGLSTGNYNGKAAASFIIPNGSVTANTGSVLNSVSINSNTGQLSGTTVALPVVPTNVSELNNDEDYQSGQDV